MSDIWDFGFTAVSEDELDAVKKSEHEAVVSASAVDASQDKLDLLYNAIMPLLTNLKSNPDKDYILWPDRLSKVEAFEDHIQKIYQS
jgi:hypothetical protein